MNRLITFVTALTLATTFTACKSKKDEAPSGGAAASKSTEEMPAAKAAEAKGPTMAVTEADWVEKDLSTVSPMIHVSMRVPKDAKLEKNGNGGVDVRVSDFYMLTVSGIAVSNIAEGIKSDKSLTIDRKDQYINTKVLSEAPNGFVYTMQMKDEANGTKYQPEAHFAHYVEKEGAIYSILDQRPMDAFSTPGSAYTEDIAKKVYEIVKASAKAK